jgi:organic radical activating enzyme
MTSIREAIRRRFAPAKPIEPGIYHYQSPPYSDYQYRMHLRIEKDGRGILIIDASTILHLNQTAAEYAYHFINQTPIENAIKKMGRRYDISPNRLENDYKDFKDKIFSLIDLPDLDPVTFLDFERDTPYSEELSAPLRLDCALTYLLPEGTNDDLAPTKRVDRELSTDEWFTIIDKAWDAGIPHIVFTGGEPTLREDLFDLITRAEINGQVTGLLTDGRRLSKPEYLYQLLQTGLDHLMVVLNDEDDLVWEALEKILPEDIFTTVHITITTGNSERVHTIIDRLAKIGTNAISLSDIGSDLDDVLQDARALIADREIPLVWDLPVPYSARNPVALESEDDDLADGAGKAWLYIEPDGDVLPGQGTNQVLGNLLRDSWEVLWNK